MTAFQSEYAPLLRDLLVGVARRGEVLTYGNAAKILGLSHHRPMRYFLGSVGQTCREQGEPILTALVVNASDGWLA